MKKKKRIKVYRTETQVSKKENELVQTTTKREPT